MSDFQGPTWGQWRGTVRDIEATRGAAIAHANNAQAWKAYAANLEAQLDELWEMFREAQGNGSGQRRIKEAALEEIKRLDPSNSLLEKPVRQKLFDEGKEADQQTVPKKRP